LSCSRLIMEINCSYHGSLDTGKNASIFVRVAWPLDDCGQQETRFPTELEAYGLQAYLPEEPPGIKLTWTGGLTL
jgi:hypothetical protein